MKGVKIRLGYSKYIYFFKLKEFVHLMERIKVLSAFYPEVTRFVQCRQKLNHVTFISITTSLHSHNVP